MDIPNLNSQASQVNQSKPVTTNKFLVPAIIIVVAVVSGFGLSRIIPTNTPVTNLNPTTSGGDTSQKLSVPMILIPKKISKLAKFMEIPTRSIRIQLPVPLKPVLSMAKVLIF
jgi:hypothetical protein